MSSPDELTQSPAPGRCWGGSGRWSRPARPASRCIDPARGRIVANVKVAGWITQFVTAAGNRLLVAAMGREGDDRGGGVSLHAADGRQLWRLGLPGDAVPRLIAGDGECVLVSAAAPEGAVLICADISDGRRWWTLPLKQLAIGDRWCQSAVRSGDRLYVMFGFPVGAENDRKAPAGDFAVLTCLDAADGRMVWHRRIDAAAALPALVSAPAVTPNQVIVCTRKADTLACHIHVFDRETGVPVHAGKQLTGPYLSANATSNGNVERRWNRALHCALPEAVGPWLLVETPDGVEVWGGK